MKVYKTIGSKERFLEMFQRVNKVMLNEDFNSVNNDAIVTTVLNKIKNGEMTIKNSQTQTINDNSYIILMASDSSNGIAKLTFIVNSQAGDQDGIGIVNDVELKEFSYKDGNGTQTYDLNEDDLREFNQQYGQELYDIVDKYIDVEPQGVEDIENSSELAEAIKMIDAIKKDSYPFGGGSDRMQTGKAYADEKPTNAAVRVKSPELDKYIQEEISSLIKPINPSTKSPIENLPEDKKKVILQAIDNLTIKRGRPEYRPNVHEIQNELNNITNSGTIKENDIEYGSDEQSQYDDMALPQDYGDVDVNTLNLDDEPEQPEIDEPFERVSPEKEKIILTAYENLIGRNKNNPNYSPTLHDIKLEIDRIEGVKPPEKKRVYPREAEPFLEALYEEDDNYPKPLGKKFKIKKRYPKKRENVNTSVNIGESTDQEKYENVVFLQGDDAYEPLERLNREGKDAALEYLKQWHYPGEHEGTNQLGHGTSDQVYEKDGYIMSWNPYLGYIGLQYDLSQMNEEEIPDENIEISMDDNTGDNIEQLAKDKEETGEILQGGIGDGKSPLEFDVDQVIKGLEVEKEHTENPMIALEIVMDHLTEDPEYYTEKNTPEASAQAGASGDANDKELTDNLLGFKPHNVGDDVDESKEEIFSSDGSSFLNKIKTEKPNEYS